jgi:hypothetical protein
MGLKKFLGLRKLLLGFGGLSGGGAFRRKPIYLPLTGGNIVPSGRGTLWRALRTDILRFLRTFAG